MLYKKYKIGTYKLNNKRKYIRKKKFNRTFRGTLTIRKQKEQRRVALLLITGFILIGIVQSVVVTTKTIHIDGSAVSASECVEPLLVGEVVPPAPSPADVVEISAEQQIRKIAKEHNFKWENYLLRLAKCENRTLDPRAINDKGNTPIGSIDRGIFQINDYWHSEISDECAYSVRCSTEFAIDMINSGRQNEWVCNKIVLKN